MRTSICEQCHQPFSYVNKGKSRRFCGPACYAASMIGIDKGGLVTAECATCGRPFTVKRFYFNRKDGKTFQRFCSRDCATPAINAAHQKHVERACALCGALFMPRLNKGYVSEFCSRRCASASGRATQALIDQQVNGTPTSIERRMMDALDRARIPYVFQYPIYSKIGLKRFSCDFGFPDAMLIVECDGTYWHAKPGVAQKDKTKDAYLNACGYTVLRFSEAEINQDVGYCVQIILSYL